MKKWSSRHNPRFYDGSRLTCHNIKDLLPEVLADIGHLYKQRGDLICEAWPEIIGHKLSLMTKAYAFNNGVLYVKVQNSTLYSLLVQNDKAKILHKLRCRFPKTKIKTIAFTIG